MYKYSKVISMDKMEDAVCKENYSIKPPEFIEVKTTGSIDITGNMILLSPQGCCAQTVLPFWARVIGTVKNLSQQETMIQVTVILFNNEDEELEKHSDIVIVDAGQKGNFDVKLPEYNKHITKYSIKAEETEEYI
jgi:hypothetical protein